MLPATSRLAPDHPAIRYLGHPGVLVTPEQARFCRPIEGSDFSVDAAAASIRFRASSASATALLRLSGEHRRSDVRDATIAVRIDRGGWRRVVLDAVDAAVPLWDGAADHLRDCEIVLPYGEAVEFLGVDFAGRASAEPAPTPSGGRYVAYGDSITQGFWARDPVATYPYRVGELLGMEAVNLGCGGRQLTAADGVVLAGIDADVVTVLMGVNDHLHGKPPEVFGEDLAELLRHFRRSQALTTIHVLTPLWSSEPYESPLGLPLERYRQAVRDVVAGSRDDHISVIEGPDLVPADPMLFVDGIHPNADGFAVLASRLAGALGCPARSTPREVDGA